MFRRPLYSFIFLMLVSSSFAFICLETPWLTPTLARWYIQKNFKNFPLQSIHISQQDFRFPGQLTWNDIHITLKINREDAQFDIKQLTLQDLLDGLMD